MNPDQDLERINDFLVAANDQLTQLSEQITKVSAWPKTKFRQDQLDRVFREQEKLLRLSGQACQCLKDLLA